MCGGGRKRKYKCYMEPNSSEEEQEINVPRTTLRRWLHGNIEEDGQHLRADTGDSMADANTNVNNTNSCTESGLATHEIGNNRVKYTVSLNRLIINKALLFFR